MMQQIIARSIQNIRPFDEVEQRHIDDALCWIASGQPLCRIAKPASPPKHLVCYFLVVDAVHRRALLVDHLNACLRLPNGGHVEPGEHPADTVRRESVEELGIEATFLFPQPIFLTVTETVGATAGHTDVSLWYVIRGDSSVTPWFDRDECRDARWFALDDLPLDRADPHLERFATKLNRILDETDQGRR